MICNANIFECVIFLGKKKFSKKTKHTCIFDGAEG